MRCLILNLPSPAGMNINKSWAGTYGTGYKVRRNKEGHTGPVLFPIEMLYTASALSKEDFKIVDAQADNLDTDAIVNIAIEYKPDVVISMPSLPSMKNDLEILFKLKQLGCKIAAYGAVSSLMEKPEEVDTVITGSYPYYSGVKKLMGKGSGKEDLDSISIKAYDLFDIKKYLMSGEKNADGKTMHWFPILTSVGCKYGCAYCPYPLVFGRKIIHKSIATILQEIRYLKEKGVRTFLFRDIVFTYNRKRVLELCKQVKKFNISFFFETRADLVDEEMLNELKSAGCFKINYGLETGNHEVLKKIGKPTVSIETYRNAFRLTRAAGIMTHAHIILGLPGETRKTLEDTYRLVSEINPDMVNWNIITPYPGTALYKMAEKKGWISDTDYSHYTSYNAVMGNEHLSPGYLRFVRNKFIIKRMIKRFLK